MCIVSGMGKINPRYVRTDKRCKYAFQSKLSNWKKAVITINIFEAYFLDIV